MTDTPEFMHIADMSAPDNAAYVELLQQYIKAAPEEKEAMRPHLKELENKIGIWHKNDPYEDPRLKQQHDEFMKQQNRADELARGPRRDRRLRLKNLPVTNLTPSKKKRK